MKLNQTFIKKWSAEFGGLAVGIQILVKAFDKLPYFSHYPLHIGFLFSAGLFVIIGSIFHHLLEKYIKHSHALFHLIEGFVFIISALLLFEKGKIRLPAFIIFIGFIYLLIGVIGYKVSETNYKQISKPLFRWLGITFLLFGFIAMVINWNYDKNTWVFIIASLFVFIGLFYSFFTNRILIWIDKFDKYQKETA